MTRRGCGCCNCSPKTVDFDWNYYEAKDTRVYHKRNLSFVEEIEVFTQYYDPDTGRRTSSEESGVIATFQHDPIEQEFALTERETDFLISCNIEIDANRFVYHTIDERNDQGRLLVRKIYRGKLTAEGSHISKVAIESDFSDAYEFGQGNRHGYRTTSNIVIRKYSLTPSLLPTQAGLPGIRLQTKFSSDEAPGFSNESYDVQYRLQASFHNSNFDTGPDPDLQHEFSPFNSLDQMPEDMESFDQSFSDPLAANENMGDAKWDDKRPTIKPGVQTLERQEDTTLAVVSRRGYTLVEREPSGPVSGKTYTLIRPGLKGSMVRFGGDITSHYVHSYVTPEYDENRRLQNEFAGEPDAVRDNPRRYASTGALYEEPIQDIYINSLNEGVRTKKRNWRSRGWSRLGYMSFESTKAYKDNTSIHLHELCFQDSFSRTERDVYLGDEEFRMSVEFIDAVSGDVEFSQQFSKGYHSLSEDIDHEFFFDTGDNTFPNTDPVPGTIFAFRGHIDADFDWLKRYPYQYNIDGDPEYKSDYAQFRHDGIETQIRYTGSFGFGVSAAAGMYQVDGDGMMKLLEGVPVSQGGLLHIGTRQSATRSYILKEQSGSSFSETLKSSISDPKPPATLVAGLDYADDIRMHFIETSGDFGDGMCQSFSHRPLIGGSPRENVTAIIPTWCNELARAVNDAGIQFTGAVPQYRSFSYPIPWLYNPYRKPGVDRALLDASTSPHNVESYFFTTTAAGAIGSYPLSTESVQKMVEDGVERAGISYFSSQATQVSSGMSAPRTPTDASVLSFRVRDSHIDMGSFKQLLDTGFEDGIQFSYKPLRYSNAISERERFAGFRLRFEIEGEDHFPGRIHTIGLADPDNNNREGCNEGECSMDPYSVLNYDIEVTGRDGLEHVDATSAYYRSCRTTIDSIPGATGLGGIETHQAQTHGLTAYRPDNAGDLNSHSFGAHHPDISYAFYGGFYRAISTAGGFYHGLSYSSGTFGNSAAMAANGFRPWELYDIKDANIYCSRLIDNDLKEFLTAPEATVDVSGGPCWHLPENHPDCYREHTVEYKPGGSFSVEPGQFANWFVESNYEEIPMTGPGCDADDTFSATTEIIIKPFGPPRDLYHSRARSIGLAATVETESLVYSSRSPGSASLGDFGTEVDIDLQTYTEDVENSEGEIEQVERSKLVVTCHVYLPGFREFGYYDGVFLADKVSDILDPGFSQIPEELPRPGSIDVGFCIDGGAVTHSCTQNVAGNSYCRQYNSHTAVSFLSGSQEGCSNRPQPDPAGVVYDYYVDGRFYTTADQGEGEMILNCGTWSRYDATFGPPVSVGDPISREYSNAGDISVRSSLLEYMPLTRVFSYYKHSLGSQEVELDDDFNPLDPPDVTLEFTAPGRSPFEFVSSINSSGGINGSVEYPSCPNYSLQLAVSGGEGEDELVQTVPDHIGYKEVRKNWSPQYTPVYSEFTGVTVKLRKRS